MGNIGKGSPPAAFQNFDKLPDSAFVRQDTLCWLFDCPRETIWHLTRTGKLPKPARISTQMRAWNVGEVRQAIKEMSREQPAAA